MIRKEIYCCLGCGRDTTRKDKYCNKCMPGKKTFRADNENKGRRARSVDVCLGPIDIDFLTDDSRPLKHSLIKELTKNEIENIF